MNITRVTTQRSPLPIVYLPKIKNSVVISEREATSDQPRGTIQPKAFLKGDCKYSRLIPMLGMKLAEGAHITPKMV